MTSKAVTYRQAIEFNRKTFAAKRKRRNEMAKLTFEEKLEIVCELNKLGESMRAQQRRQKS